MSGMLVTFIIPHKGREHLLIETLFSIKHQDFDLSQVQIVIITQNDSLSDDVIRFRKQLNLKIFHCPQTDTISALRNFGVANSQSKYLAFLDADIQLSTNWLEAMLATLQTKDQIKIASAVQRNSKGAPPLEMIRTALSNPTIDQSVDFLPGRNLFLRRDTFEQIGGFPENLVTCEDYYFTNMANQIGDLFYTSTANYIHLGEDKEYSEMFKKEIWRGQSNLISISGREIPLNEIPSFIVPIVVVGLPIVALVLLVTGYDMLALASLSLGLLPIVVYTLRLYFLTRDHKVSFLNTLKFYVYYFPARAIGTLGGVFKTIHSRSHGR